MKRNITLLVLVAFMVTAPLLILAQTPPHPNGGSNPGPGNGPVGGGAAIGSGLTILLAMGAAYGSHKLYQIRSKATLDI